MTDAAGFATPPTVVGATASATLPGEHSAALLGGIVALAADAVLSLDEAQRIVLFNHAAEQVFGYAAAEVLGQPLDLLLPERYRERHRAEHVPAFAASPEASRRMGERRAVFGRRKSGEEFPAEVAISKAVVEGCVRYHAVVRDVTARTRQEEALRASEARWRTLVEAAHDGVFVCDEDDVFVLVNPAFAAMCGRPPRELLGMRVADVVAPEDLARTPLRREELQRAGRLQTERTLRRPDGARVHVEVGVTRLAHGEIQCVVRDVTERRRMEDALRASERRFRGIFDSTYHFIGLLTPAGAVLEANRAALDFAGVTADSVIGRPFWDTPWWSHSPDAQARLRDAVAQAALGAFVRFETEHRGADGRVALVDFSLKPVVGDDGGVTLLVPEGHDVTESRRTASLLRESEETFRSVFEHSGTGMAIVGLDGRWQRVNRALCAFLGYDESELPARTLQEITHPADLDADLAYMRELLAGDRAAYQLEKRYVRKDGRVVWGLLNRSLVRDHDGAPRFFVSQVQDVTARREADEALERSNGELARSNAELARSNAELARSNADLEQFAYVAGHDLRAPLRAVGSYTQLLAQRYAGQLDTRADGYIRHATDGVQRMQALIDDLLALARVGTDARGPAPTAMDAVLARVLESLAPTIAEADAVVTAAPLPTVLGDARQLEQLLANLLGNAVKFRRSDARPEVHLSAEPAGDGRWAVTVRDNGIGLDPARADQIFAVFRRLHTEDEYPGTGIGLAICKKIVERHGGEIRVESAPGQGATFRFTLPGAP